jgi:hypothetical protein
MPSLQYYCGYCVWFKTDFGNLQNEQAKGCKCPPGFKGDGIHSCEGIIIVWDVMLQPSEY